MKKTREIFGKIPVSPVLFAIFTVLYCETLMHLWITEEFLLGRFAAILAFALGFGGLVGQIVSFFGHKKWGKWVTFVLVFLISVFYIVEFFVNDAYKVFMPVKTLIGGAGGVARDFGDVVVNLIVSDFWRIILMLLPSLLYALLAAPKQTSWRGRWFGLVLAVAAYLGGYGIVQAVEVDVNRLTSTYEFDSAIRVFGLNMGMALDLTRGAEADQAPTFTIAQPAPVQTQSQEQVPQETEAAEIVYGDNVMDIDFNKLIEETSYAKLKSVHQYVASVTPTKKNEYTGLFEGKNLILITAEAFSAEVIDPERTPTLYRLANEGIKFNDYYQPAWGGSTTTGEYSNLMGLVPTNAGGCMKEVVQQKMFLTIGHQLNKLGYHSVAYHNHNHDFYDRNITHTKLGYDQFLARYGGLDITGSFPESDLQMIDLTVSQYIDKQPFSVYYMTVSGHSVYNQNNSMSKKNYDVVKDLPYSERVKCYFAANQELEYAMAELVRQLEEAGIADDTVIVLATDHYPYGLERSTAWDNSHDYLPELYGVKEYDKFVRDHNALIIWSGCLEDMDIVVDDPVYSLDILPTISNLFGVEYDSRLLVGRDVFSDAEPIVLWQDHSWKTDQGTYDSRNGVYTPNEGYTADEAYVDYISTLVSNKITFSRSVQELDYYNSLLDQVEGTEEPVETTAAETTAETTAATAVPTETAQ